MTVTPWGDARELRSRKPAGGPDAVREQRERVYAAMVATVAERGFECTRVTDVVELAGVSRSAFYELFEDRFDCFVQTLKAILVLAEAAMALELVRDEPWDERLRRSFSKLVDLIVAQPAAARMCLVDAHGASPEAVAHVDRMARAAGRRALAVLHESPERADIPHDIARAVIGGLRKVIQTRLYTGREEELPGLVPDLMDWALGYRTPPVPLRGARPAGDAAGDPPSPGPADARERIVAAVTEVVAEKGYADTAVTEVAAAAGLSLSDFYESFDDLGAAFLAALEDAAVRVLDVAVPAFRNARDWPHGIRDSLEAALLYLSLEPTTARVAVQAVPGGPAAMTRLDASTARFHALLAEGLRGRSRSAGVVAEAIGASLLALVYDETVHRDPRRLPELAPAATFVALAPAVGAIEACAVING